MTPWYFVAAGLFAAWAIGMGYWLTRKAPTGPPPEDPVPADYFQKPAPLPPGHVLYPAPRWGPDTLRDGLIHRYHEDGVWAEVVSKFYGAAAADPEIYAYFKHLDTAGMERLQVHFCSALCILAHTGLTVGALNAMQKKHAALGITGPVFDRTILALAGVLDAVGVPDDVVQQLNDPVQELRAVIVTA